MRKIGGFARDREEWNVLDLLVMGKERKNEGGFARNREDLLGRREMMLKMIEDGGGLLGGDIRGLVFLSLGLHGRCQGMVLWGF